MRYRLNDVELERLKNGLSVAMAIPFIDDIEDYILEAIWEYVKGFEWVDPLFNSRSKQLYDVIDPNTRIGWSVKSLQKQFSPGARYEMVIQRSDIFDRAQELGFTHLDKNSPTADLGRALLRHWENKITQDAQRQNVISQREFILFKSEDRKRFTFVEQDMEVYEPEDLEWSWTNADKKGLQGIRKSDNQVVYRWYSSQKQLFACSTLPNNLQVLEIDPIRLTKQQLMDIMVPHIIPHQEPVE